ncbi:MAG TPA: lytic transglycosylase domain-containing protein [Gaiellaceae bacterium]|jgi:soluble lytic murein transglycosylase|nr:lytic transglycosylase domain-containing protein [Gaiellaceae bacterium]
MSRLLSATVLVAVLAAAFLYVNEASPPWYERLRYPLRYQQIVRGHAAHYDLDPAFLAAVIYTESKFDASARSDSGAVGLMQLTPETAKGIAIRTGGHAFTVADLDDPEINVRYGAWYLRHLFRKYHDQRLVLAAYNAGQGNVDRWLADGGEIRFAETKAYVDRVQEVERIYRDAYAAELGYR